MRITVAQLKKIIKEAVEEISDAERDWERKGEIERSFVLSAAQLLKLMKESGMTPEELDDLKSQSAGYGEFFSAISKKTKHSPGVWAMGAKSFWDSGMSATDIAAQAAEHADLSGRFETKPLSGGGDPYFRAGEETTHKPSGKKSSWQEEYRSPSTYRARDRKRQWR